jgi:hypothetical protein
MLSQETFSVENKKANFRKGNKLLEKVYPFKSNNCVQLKSDFFRRLYLGAINYGIPKSQIVHCRNFFHPAKFAMPNIGSPHIFFRHRHVCFTAGITAHAIVSPQPE